MSVNQKLKMHRSTRLSDRTRRAASVTVERKSTRTDARTCMAAKQGVGEEEVEEEKQDVIEKLFRWGRICNDGGISLVVASVLGRNNLHVLFVTFPVRTLAMMVTCCTGIRNVRWLMDILWEETVMCVGSSELASTATG